MAQIEDGIALGIGAQTAKGSINIPVRDAVDLITGPATGTNATGILLRNAEDLAKSMERIQTDLGVLPGSRTRATGGFIRVDATVSFDIDWKGNGETTGTPDADDYDAQEYLLQILQGNRLLKGTGTTSETPYAYGIPSAAEAFKTLKIWRGTTVSSESWVLQDCQFNLTWAWTAGDKCILTVDVLVGSVSHSIGDTFPPATPAAAYGNQVDAPPILGTDPAGASINGSVRGFLNATLSSVYPVVDALDSNVATGVSKELGSPREVAFSADWYAETGEDDFADSLEQDAGIPIFFTLGIPAPGAAALINAWKMTIPLFRGETHDKVDVEHNKVVRTITGYASHTTVDAELLLEAL